MSYFYEDSGQVPFFIAMITIAGILSSVIAWMAYMAIKICIN